MSSFIFHALSYNFAWGQSRRILVEVAETVKIPNDLSDWLPVQDTGALQLETALVLVRLDDIASVIVNANQSIM